MQVAISGDFEPEELERELVRYMGILGAGEGAGAEKQEPWRGREGVFRLHYAAGWTTCVSPDSEERDA